jgi:serine O-acetyltransferase
MQRQPRTNRRTPVFDAIRRDIRTVLERDPAARSTLEVLVCYPGVHALAFHRLGHRLWRGGWRTLARFVSQVSRFATGIEIHPAAVIGAGLFIDHGMGVVIGETAEVGDNVTLLQGVTLGGTSLRREKRHPTLGDNVVVGAGAKIIGAFKIGDNSRIGAGSVVVREVPPNAVVVGVPGRVTYKDGQRVGHGIDLNQTDLPDPVARMFEQMMERIRSLEADLEALKKTVDRDQFKEEDSPVTPSDVLSLKEASTYLAMDEQTLASLAHERRIPSLQVDGSWVFSKKSIDKWRSLQSRMQS